MKKLPTVDQLQFFQARLQNAINKACTCYQNDIRNKLKKGVNRMSGGLLEILVTRKDSRIESQEMSFDGIDKIALMAM
jgi:hypothetical protein